MSAAGSSIARLLEVMRLLRDPEQGCPWDKEQTFGTIAPYTIEEAYEVADAIARGRMDELEGELGDLLLQVVYHARIAEEAGLFDFERVAHGIAEKMIRRHPHVFGTAEIDGAAAQSVAWEEAKAAERRAKATDESSAQSTLDDVPMALPALTRAAKLQKRAARVGFDWTTLPPILAKIREELDELEAELGESPAPARIADELGDLLFAVVNLARRLDVDPEAALRQGNAKFERRFRAIEARLAKGGRRAQDLELDALEALWVLVKAEERG